VGADLTAAETICKKLVGQGILQVANLNSPGQVVLAGENKVLAQVEAIAKELGVRKVISLKVSGAFHSEIMAPAREELAKHIQAVPFAKPRIPVISNVTARPSLDPEQIRRQLIEQMCKPVRWEESIRFLIQNGCDNLLEIGPGTVLAGLAKRIDKNITAQSTNGCL
jgi:[acyl-carrier-protein] S-malonyltransferase